MSLLVASLTRGRRLAAIGGAASGGEGEHIGAARDLSGRRHRIVARRIHEHEALCGHRLGVVVDVIERGRAALRGGAERFLENGRQSAGLVAGRGIVVHFAAAARAIILPPMDSLDQLAADLRRRRAARQQMFGAVDLRRLREDRRAAVAHQNVGGGAERRIGGDPRIAVRAATLKREREFARRRRRRAGRDRAAAAWRGRARRRPRPSCACPRSPGWSGCGTPRSRRPRIPPSCGRSETPRSPARPSSVAPMLGLAA